MSTEKKFPIRKPEPTRDTTRQCTDSCALGCFGSVVVLMAISSVYGIAQGNYRRLLYGYDYSGRLCGVDPGVQDRPFVYFCGGSAFSGVYPDMLNFHSKTCVPACPQNATATKIECLSRVLTNFSYQGPGFLNGVPVVETSVVDITQTVTLQTAYPSTAHASRYCIPLDGTLEKSLIQGPLGQIHSVSSGLASLWKAKWILLGTTFLSAVLGLIFLAALGRFAGMSILVCLVLGTIALLAASIFFGIGVFFSPEVDGLYQRANPLFMALYGQHVRVNTFFVGFAFFLFAIYTGGTTWVSFPEKIDEVVGIVCVATDCIFSPGACSASLPSFELITQPLVQGICMCGLLCLLGAGLVGVLSTGHIVPYGITINGVRVQGFQQEFEYEWWWQPVITFYICGMIWIMTTAMAVGTFAIQYSVCDWFFVVAERVAKEDQSYGFLNELTGGNALRKKDVFVKGAGQFNGPRDAFVVNVGAGFNQQQVAVVPMGQPDRNGRWTIQPTYEKTIKTLGCFSGFTGAMVGIGFHLGSLSLAGVIVPLTCLPRLLGDGIKAFMGKPHTRERFDKDDDSLCGQFKALMSFIGIAIDYIFGGSGPTTYADMILSNTNFLTASRDSFNFINSVGGPLALLHGSTAVFETVTTLFVGGIAGLTAGLIMANDATYSNPTSSNYIDHHAAVVFAATALGLFVGGTYMSLFSAVSDSLLYVASWSRQHYSYEPDASGFGLKMCVPGALKALMGESFLRQSGDNHPKLAPPPEMNLRNLGAFGGQDVAGKFLSTLGTKMRSAFPVGRNGAGANPAEQSPLLRTMRE